MYRGWGGDVRRLEPLNLPNASGALANSTMKTVGQVDLKIKMSNINFFFEGSACFAVHATKGVVRFYAPIYSVRDVWLPLKSVHRRFQNIR